VKWWLTAGFGALLLLVLVCWLGLAAWKAAAIAGVTVVAGFAVPAHPVVPFSVAFAALAAALANDEGSSASGWPPPGASRSRSCRSFWAVFSSPDFCSAGPATRG